MPIEKHIPMRSKYIQKMSLVDYPRHIASVIFIGGCNFDCQYCFNRPLVDNHTEYPNISIEEVLSTIRSREKYIDGIVITGGEPTLDPGLPNLLKVLKDNFDKDIKLDTNGYEPEILSEIIESKTVDYVAMDIKAQFEEYSKVIGVTINIDDIKDSIQIIKNSGIEHEFRTTIWKNHPLQEVDNLYPLKILEGENWYLQNFHDPAGDIPGFEPLSKKEVSEILEKLKPIHAKIKLRGDWY